MYAQWRLKVSIQVFTFHVSFVLCSCQIFHSPAGPISVYPVRSWPTCAALIYLNTWPPFQPTYARSRRLSLHRCNLPEGVMAYTAPLAIGRDEGHSPSEVRKLDTLRDRYSRTLKDRPWQSCDCEVCRKAGVEVIIFRASNRNKRRGIHNLQAYRRHIGQLERA
jgi:hypothetical protein